jgi:hypothetical protein
VSLEEVLRNESLHHLLESRLEQGQENAGDGNMVTGQALSGHFTLAVDSQRARNVANRHLVALLNKIALIWAGIRQISTDVFLDPDFLEFDELGSSCLQSEAAT